ncbi:uncharacterized protein C2orf66 homolog [Brachyhypopomus gauderio]|uniref:uncharacterized protein C2orf66 homolog n=1 Tax=Brachyhypopomus gauderio TaxID=698409 RepID=UPI004041AF55
MLAMLVLVALVGISESDPSNTEEWKSLNNPKSRILFFQILQSYLDDRDSQAQGLGQRYTVSGLGRKTSMKQDKNSQITSAAFDKYSNLLHNFIDVYDI